MSLQSTPARDLGTAVAWLQRWWRLIALGVLVGILVGVLALFLLPKAYRATAAVLVSPADGESTDSLNMDTELQVVKSTTVGQAAAEMLGVPEEANDVLRRTTLFVPANSTVIQITYEGDSPDGARAGAEAVSQAYLDTRAATQAEAIEDQVDVLTRQRNKLNKQAGNIRQRLAESRPGSPGAQQQQSDLDSTLGQISDVNAQLAELETSRTLSGRVITPAMTPGSPSSPDKATTMASALMLGLLLGLGLAYLAERRTRRSITSPEQLAALPSVTYAADLRNLPGLTGLHRADHQTKRELERVLTWSAPQPGHVGSLVLVSAVDPSSAAARSVAAANLAAHGTTPRSPSVLVIRDPLSSLLDVARNVPDLQVLGDPNQGLRGGHDLGGARLFNAATDPDLSAPLTWEPDVLQRLTDAASTHLVVVELPALSESADPYALAPRSDAVIVVAAEGSPTRQAAETLEQIASVTSAPVIAVLTRHPVPPPAPPAIGQAPQEPSPDEPQQVRTR